MYLPARFVRMVVGSLPMTVDFKTSIFNHRNATVGVFATLFYKYCKSNMIYKYHVIRLRVSLFKYLYTVEDLFVQEVPNFRPPCKWSFHFRYEFQNPRHIQWLLVDQFGIVHCLRSPNIHFWSTDDCRLLVYKLDILLDYPNTTIHIDIQQKVVLPKKCRFTLKMKKQINNLNIHSIN